jgi:hypothetical protein
LQPLKDTKINFDFGTKIKTAYHIVVILKVDHMLVVFRLETWTLMTSEKGCWLALELMAV